MFFQFRLYTKCQQVMMTHKEVLHSTYKECFMNCNLGTDSFNHWRRQNDNWGGGGGEAQIFIYSCSQPIKTINLKRNQLGRTQIYEYLPSQL